jgi:hypothetical protein
MHTRNRKSSVQSLPGGRLFLVVLIPAYLVLLCGAVDAIRWVFGGELWVTLPLLNLATFVVIASEFFFWRERRKDEAAAMR